MNTNKSLRDSFIVGFALFAVFFGAGNLIFPPSIGLVSGTNWIIAVLGLVATGIILPILAVIAVSNTEGKFEVLTSPVGSWFYKAFNIFAMICIAMSITIPRTAATTHELGVQPLFPQVPIAVTIVIFFALTYYFTNDKSNVIDKIGKVLTPALLIILLIIVVKGFATPLGTPVDTGIKNPFSNAFINAYQTGDLLTGLLCATVFISMIVDKGYTDTASRKKITLNASIIAGVGLTIVYGGLLYIGAAGNSLFPQDVEKTALLVGLVKKLMGNVGVVGLSISVALACLTTAIGITASVGDFISSITNNKISYRTCVAVVCVVGTFVGLMGVEKIVDYAFPMFLAVYPVSIVLTFLGLFRKYIPNAGAYKGSVIITLIVSIIEGLGVLGIKSAFTNNLLSIMPLSSEGFAWLVPAVVGFIGGALLYKTSPKTPAIDIKTK